MIRDQYNKHRNSGGSNKKNTKRTKPVSSFFCRLLIISRHSRNRKNLPRILIRNINIVESNVFSVPLSRRDLRERWARTERTRSESKRTRHGDISVPSSARSLARIPRTELMKGHRINSTISKQKRRSHIDVTFLANVHLGSYCL